MSMETRPPDFFFLPRPLRDFARARAIAAKRRWFASCFALGAFLLPFAFAFAFGFFGMNITYGP